MKKIWLRICADIREFWAAAVILAVYFVVINLIFHAFCPTVILTGFPCPGCGLTRAIFYLAMGKIQQSIQMNPMGMPVAILLLYFFWNRYIMGKTAKGITPLLGTAVVLLVAVYLWRMYRFFPGTAPCVYTKHNILSEILPHYEQRLHDLKIL